MYWTELQQIFGISTDMDGHDQPDFLLAITQGTLLWKSIFGANRHNWQHTQPAVILCAAIPQRIATRMRALTPPVTPQRLLKIRPIYLYRDLCIFRKLLSYLLFIFQSVFDVWQPKLFQMTICCKP